MKMRRRILALCLTLCMLVGLSPVYALEAPVSGTYGTNISWTLDTDGTLTISGHGELTGGWTWTWYDDGSYSVSRQGEPSGGNPFPSWLDYASDIIEVVISDGVTSIGNCTFEGCDNLADITIPDSVTSIGGRAFSSCTNLTDITIPDSVTSIGAYAFAWCSSLTDIAIPDSVTSIGHYAFEGCTNLTDITIPDSVTKIDAGAFLHCGALETITVDSGNPAFCVEDGVLFSKDKTVLHCYPGGLRASSYTVPDTVKEIADSAFSQTRLESIMIPNTVTSIGEAAFAYCRNLTDITIPDSVTSIGDRAFEACWKFETIGVDSGNPAFCVEDGVLFSKDKTTLICYPVGKAGASYAVPDTVTTIADYAIQARNLRSVVIPDSVTSIGERAFSNCTNLTDITLPNGMTGIGNGMFSGCINLESIMIPSGVTNIDVNAFYYCSSLTSISIPDGVTSIGNGAFGDCTNLVDITIPKSVTNIGIFAFYACPNLKEVHFGGTRAQWNAITIEIYNEALQTAAIYCSDDAPAESSDTETIRYGNGAVAEIATAADGKMEANVTVPSGVTAEIEIPVKNVGMGTVAVIVHEDGTEEIIQNSVPGEESLTVTLSESAKLEIRDNAVTFSDVTEKNWFKKAVDFVSARGIMGGVGNNTFDHKSTTTRAMVFTMLARLNGVDTAGGATWYEKGTNWVVENGLSDGLNATGVIPREELAVLLWKLNGSPDADTAILDSFSDSANISASAREAVAWAVVTGVMGGNANGTMDPTGGATRAHVAQIIMNYMTKI